MKVKLLFFTTLIALWGCHSSGQQKAKSGNLTSQAKPPINPAIKFTTQVPEKNYQGLNAGDIAPDAVKIEADYIYSMVNGAIVIVKGNQQALMDISGKLIVPWGKYQYTYSSSYSNNLTGLINVRDVANGKNGLINSKGEVFTFSRDVGDFNNYFRISSVNKPSSTTVLYYIDTKGNTLPGDYNYKLSSEPSLSEGVRYKTLPDRDRIPYFKNITVKTASSTTSYPDKIGFVDRNGKPAFPDLFDDAEIFNDGLCCVKQIDKFGETKWGFIDRSGKLVIPYTYRIKPGNFFNGLALVQPMEDADFAYAYIDKKGNIKIKIGTKKGQTPAFPAGQVRNDIVTTSINAGGYFINGLAFWKNRSFWSEPVLLDTTGKFHRLVDYINVPGIAKTDSLFINSYNEIGIYYSNRSSKTLYENNRGIVDYKGNSIFPAIFANINPDFYSSYAIASVKLPRLPNSTKDQYTSGIVNKQGVFVVVIADKPKF